MHRRIWPILFILLTLLFFTTTQIRSSVQANEPDLEHLPDRMQTVTLSASLDNTLYQDAEGDVSNGAGHHIIAGRTNNGSLNRAVIAFDLSGIPFGSTIHSATLELTADKAVGGSQTMNLHRITSDWGEGNSAQNNRPGQGAAAQSGDATWLHAFFDNTFWTTPGGDFDSGVIASQTVSDDLGVYSWSSAAMALNVQEWRDGDVSNYGWILRGNESVNFTSKRFLSRNSTAPGDHPRLIVTYTPPPEFDLYLPLTTR